MENLVSELFFMPFLIGAIFIPVAAIMYLYPPGKINYLYGYRTKSSMQSQERWDFAQKFSSIQMIKCGAILVVMSFTGILFPIDESMKFTIGCILSFIPIAFIFILTEKAIKSRFNKQ